MRPPHLAIALTAALALSTPTPAFAKDNKAHHTVHESIGVNIHFTDARPGEMEMLGASGLGWVRMDFTWGSTEPTKGVYDFRHFDTLLADLDKRHMRAMLILDYGNEIYGASGKPPYDDVGRAAFAAWAVAAVDHFQNRRVLWELWNEPNGDWFWPKHSSADYVVLAQTVENAIHAKFPHEALTGPATSTIDIPFLTDCFKGGCLEFWSAVSVHPYRQTDPETAAAEYANLRDIIAKYAPHGKTIPIISGEWGYPVHPGGVSEDQQAKYVVREFLTNLENGIPLSIWYDWHDDGVDPNNAEHNFGLVHNEYHADRTPVYEPKPAYVAVQTLTSTLGDFAFDHSVSSASAATDHVDAFGRGKERRYAAWSKSSMPHPVVIPVPVGPYEVVDWQGKRRRVEADKSGLTVTVADMPQYVVAAGK